MKPSVKQKAREWTEKNKSPCCDLHCCETVKAFLSGYEQGQYDLSQELAIGFFKRFGDKYARRYDLVDRGKKK